jgi:hypothetical protein
MEAAKETARANPECQSNRGSRIIRGPTLTPGRQGEGAETNEGKCDQKTERESVARGNVSLGMGASNGQCELGRVGVSPPSRNSP